MFVGIAIEVKSGAGWFTQPCVTRSRAKVEALQLAKRHGIIASYRIAVRPMESFKLYLESEGQN